MKLVLICAGNFAALCCRVSPCGARYFPSDGKAPKGLPGDGSGWTLRVHIRLPYPLCRFATSPLTGGVGPRSPITGTRTCWILQHFRRAKSEWLVSIPAGPLGPGRMENCVGCNSTAAPSLAEQVIAGPSSSGRSGTGPYERRDSFCIRRRGGCPHLPVPSPWEPTPLMGRIIISLKGTAGKIRRRNAVSHQVLLVTFLPRKVTPPPGCNRC